jgi:hypothetical protein
MYMHSLVPRLLLGRRVMEYQPIISISSIFHFLHTVSSTKTSPTRKEEEQEEVMNE